MWDLSCKSKISYFPLASFPEDIRWLKISMNNIFWSKILTSLRYLIDYCSPLELIFLLDILVKVSSLAKFSNEVAIGRTIEYFNKTNYIRMIKFLKKSYFLFEKMRICNFHIFGFYYFDGVPNWTVIIFDSFIDFASVATSDKMLEIKTISTYSLLSFAFRNYFIF